MPTDDSNRDIRSAHRASVLSIAWTVLAGSLLVVIGARQSSTALVAVGAVGFVDAIGSVALAHHFARALRHDRLDDRFERRAHRIVTVGLLVVGGATIAVSVVRLAGGATGGDALAGSVVAGASAVVLAVLARVKMRVGRRVPSPALVADGRVSAIGSAQGVVACTGAVLASTFDVASADAIAATLVAVVAIAVAIGSWTPPGD